MPVKLPNVVECASNSIPGSSTQMEALDLPGFYRAGSGNSRTNDLSTDRMAEACRGQRPSLPPEAGGRRAESHGASFEGHTAHGTGSKEGSLEPEVRCQEPNVGVTPSEPIRDTVSLARKSHSTSKVNSKGVLVGVKRNKKGKARAQRGHQHLDGPPSADAGESLHLLS